MLVHKNARMLMIFANIQRPTKLMITALIFITNAFVTVNKQMLAHRFLLYVKPCCLNLCAEICKENAQSNTTQKNTFVE